MHFIDIFIRRPVLSITISLIIFITGIGAALTLQIRQYPYMNNATISINTSYPGANPHIIQGFITTPIEQSVGSVDGIDYMTSKSSIGMSIITVNIKLGVDPNNVLRQVIQKVNSTINQLPKTAGSPAIVMKSENSFPSLILGLSSSNLNEEQITAYIKNQLTPKLHSFRGVSDVIIWGQKPYAMRIWLNYVKMSKLGLSPENIADTLRTNSLIAAGGQIKGPYLNITLIKWQRSLVALRRVWPRRACNG